MKQFYKDIYKSEFLFLEKLSRYAWSLVYLVSFKFSPRICFKWRATLLRAFGAQIGKECKIYPGVKIWSPRNLSIGDGFFLV